MTREEIEAGRKRGDLLGHYGRPDNVDSDFVRPVCILDCDSPSYPPTDDERRQCACAWCREVLKKRGIE